MCGAISEARRLYYLDSSALVKLIWPESESEALREFVANADLLSSELAVVELPRAVRRLNLRFEDEHALLEIAGDVLDAVALKRLERSLLITAGQLDEPHLQALDAIHVASALDLMPHDGFVSYDERQAAAARLAGMGIYAPRPLSR